MKAIIDARANMNASIGLKLGPPIVVANTPRVVKMLIDYVADPQALTFVTKDTAITMVCRNQCYGWLNFKKKVKWSIGIKTK